MRDSYLPELHCMRGPGPEMARQASALAKNPLQACIVSQAALADWKAHSNYASEQWAIGRIKCVPGDYVIKRVI